MSEFDECHFQVVNALAKAGWTVDSAQLHITDNSGNDFFIDMTAIRPTGDPHPFEIAIEVKCFTLPKKTAELHRAIGQCIVYRGITERAGYDLPVYMAVPTATFAKYFNVPLLMVLAKHEIKLIEIDLDTEEIRRWIE